MSIEFNPVVSQDTQLRTGVKGEYEDKNTTLNKKITEEINSKPQNSSEGTEVEPKKENNQQLIMLPAYLKQQARLAKNIKDLNAQIKYAYQNDDTENATRYETQLTMYENQLDECKKNIENEKIKATHTQIENLTR